MELAAVFGRPLVREVLVSYIDGRMTAQGWDLLIEWALLVFGLLPVAYKLEI